MDIVKGKIGNALESVAPNHIVVVANDIYDEDREQYQSEININTNKNLSYRKGIKYTDDEIINNIIEELYIDTDEPLLTRIVVSGSNKWLAFYNEQDTVVAQFKIINGLSKTATGTIEDAYAVLKNESSVTETIVDKVSVLVSVNIIDYCPYIYSYLKKDKLIIDIENIKEGFVMGVDRNPSMNNYIEGSFSAHVNEKSSDFINIESYDELILSLIDRPEPSSNNNTAAGAALYSEPNYNVINGTVPSLVKVLFGNVVIKKEDYPDAKYIVFNEKGIKGEQYAIKNNNTTYVNQIYKNGDTIKDLKETFKYSKNLSVNKLISEIYIESDIDKAYIHVTKGSTNNWLVVRNENDNVVAQFNIKNGLQESVITETKGFVIIKEDYNDTYDTLLARSNRIELYNFNKIELSPTIYFHINKENSKETKVLDKFEKESGLTFDTFLNTSNKCIATLIDDDTASIEAVTNIKNICDEYKIKCTFATILDRWQEGLSNKYISGLKNLLLSFQDEGFNFINHSLKHDEQTWKFQYLLENEGIDFDAIEADMCKSRRLMYSAGFIDCNYVCYPWGLVSGGNDNYDKAVKIADKYFDGGVATYKSYKELNTKAKNPINALTRLQIYKGITIDEIKRHVDDCFNNSAWCIIYVHSDDKTNFDADLLRQTIEYIKQKGIEFKTFHEGIKIKKGIYQLKNNSL